MQFASLNIVKLTYILGEIDNAMEVFTLYIYSTRTDISEIAKAQLRSGLSKLSLLQSVNPHSELRSTDYRLKTRFTLYNNLLLGTIFNEH